MAKKKSEQQTIAQYLAGYINHEKDEHGNSVVNNEMIAQAIEAFESTTHSTVAVHPEHYPIPYREIKCPFAFMCKDDTQWTRSIWWRDGEYVVCFDDIPENYPRWSIGCLTLKEAKKRIKEMTQNEGWELIESDMD